MKQGFAREPKRHPRVQPRRETAGPDLANSEVRGEKRDSRPQGFHRPLALAETFASTTHTTHQPGAPQDRPARKTGDPNNDAA